MTQAASAVLAQEGMGSGSLLMTVLPFVLLIAVFYFMMIRPENKRKKAEEKMRSELAVGDEISTIGGLVGGDRNQRRPGAGGVHQDRCGGKACLCGEQEVIEADGTGLMEAGPVFYARTAKQA